MKKIRMAILALFAIIALGACVYTPVKEIKKCEKVVDIQIMRNYLFWILPEDSFRGLRLYLVLNNGKRVKIDRFEYYKWGSDRWFETAKKEHIGRYYCWTEYEKLR